MSEAWYASAFAGLFRQLGPILRRPQDPAVVVWSGELPPWGPRSAALAVSGVGWESAAAEAACAGEAVERVLVCPQPQDRTVQASWRHWLAAEPAVPPDCWVLFHAEQYAQPGFPFAPFTADSVCRWTCMRDAATGGPRWVPEEFVYLEARPGESHHFAPATSTGLACGRLGQPVLLRGLQEVIERDAVLGAWWRCYSLESWPVEIVLKQLGGDIARRVQRPNLTYRCWRVATPFSEHVTVVAVEGRDHEGTCFSIGAACRETRAASWEKAILEAIHGRHYVRYLLQSQNGKRSPRPAAPRSFAAHAVYYSLHPEVLPAKALASAAEPVTLAEVPKHEGLPDLMARLGPERPVLFRNVTPPPLAAAAPEWYVLRVLVPGLHPLHGDDEFPHLGGSHWAPRDLRAWRAMPPHPFP